MSMAVLLTDRSIAPNRLNTRIFSHVNTSSSWMRTSKEVEEYLHKLSDRYQQRCAEIVEDADKRWRAAHPGVAGSGEHYAALEAARADAEHIALKEMLEA